MSSESVQNRLEAATPDKDWVLAMAMATQMGFEDGDFELVTHAPADLRLALALVEAAHERHGRPAGPSLVPAAPGNWCRCGARFCNELTALDAFEAAP